jgi:predicted DNA-binding protein (UPF0251 family)
MPDNARATYKLWEKRQHPRECVTCSEIWGKRGPPNSFEEYLDRYPGLAHGAKRHLTRVWTPGLTVKEVAQAAGCSTQKVWRAIENGMLSAEKRGRTHYVTRTEATLWRGRKSPTGTGEQSWLSMELAARLYLFTPAELRRLVRTNKIKSKIVSDGPKRGELFLSKNQLARLRAKLGFTEQEAARRVGVTLARFRQLLKGVDWRSSAGIPLDTVNAIIKRLQSRAGYTVKQAAEKLGVDAAWVRQRIADGTIKVSKAKWDQRRIYISEPQFKRLATAKRTAPTKQGKLSANWLRQSDASLEAGVSATMIVRWAEAGEVRRQKAPGGWHYSKRSVRGRARVHWRTQRRHRAIPPAWLALEVAAGKSIIPKVNIQARLVNQPS